MKVKSQVMPKLEDLLQDCRELAKGLKIEDRTKDIGNHVTFEPNLSRPIHRWYKFKEGFSEELVRKLLSEFRPVPKSKTSFLDPFSGVGTSMLAAQAVFAELGVANVKLRGIEINPYMHF